MSIESEIKDQYSQFFVVDDWLSFKEVGDHYIETAARLKRKHISIRRPHSLLTRNIRKRLFLGIGCELILKSFYLKNGCCINKPRPQSQITAPKPYRFAHISPSDFLEADTVSFNYLIQHLWKIRPFESRKLIERGLRIAKVFRNKEGHIAVFRHDFDPRNYRDIEIALETFYPQAFSETVRLSISMQRGERAVFSISPIKDV